MSKARDYEKNTPGEKDASRLEKVARVFGRGVMRTMQALGATPYNLFDVRSSEDRQKDWGGETKSTYGHEVVFPAIYDYEANRNKQPAYIGRVYDKKGESVVPLESLIEGAQLVVLAYRANHESTRRYIVLQKSPDILSEEDSREDLIKFSVVTEEADRDRKDPERFVCASEVDVKLSNPQLTETLIIGGNYGSGVKLAIVMSLTPQHDSSYQQERISEPQERILAQTMYGVESAISRYRAEQLSKSE